MRIIRKNIKMKRFKSIIEIPNIEAWLEEINFEEIKIREKKIIQRAGDKLFESLNKIGYKGQISCYDSIRFSQFELSYSTSEDGIIDVTIYLNQRTAWAAVKLDDRQWEKYFNLLPHEVFHYDDFMEEEHYPIVRQLTEVDELQRLEDWVENDLEDWVIKKYILEFKKNW